MGGQSGGWEDTWPTAEGGEMISRVCTAVHRGLQLFKRRVPALCVSGKVENLCTQNFTPKQAHTQLSLYWVPSSAWHGKGGILYPLDLEALTDKN